jgi:predicted AlkP superfamily phosphohydrolase/phosphomutase
MLAVFVLDCADHGILARLMAEGRLPAMRSLVDRGCEFPLCSDGDALDGSVFQTLLTGMNPGRHGIHKYRQLVHGTDRYAIAKAARSPAPQVWRVLSDAGRQCCVFDVPKAFPLAGFRGQLVASWGSYTPAGEPGSSPSDLYGEVVRRFGRHPLRSQLPIPLPPAEYERLERMLLRGVEQRANACDWLLRERPHDFFMTAFSESHVGAHQFWHLRDPCHPLHDAESARLCGRAVERIYEAIDVGLARLLRSLPDDAHVMVMTQQGVQHNYTASHLLPHWLAVREGRSDRRSRLAAIDDGLGPRLRNAVRRMLPESIADRLTARKFPLRGRVCMLPGSEYSALLRINLRGREPRGEVEPAEYEAEMASLTADLLALRDAATGRPVVAEVRQPRHMYHGPLISRLPDAIVCWTNEAPVSAIECPRHGWLQRAISFTDITHSMHTSRGWGVVAGPGVPAMAKGGVRDVRDVASTIYHILDVEPPAETEGHPIVHIR